MNLRCAFCQNPYTLSRNEILFALQKMDSENLSHYDAHCPRCRRVTQIPRQRMEMAFPNWREAVQEAANAPATPVTPAPVVQKSMTLQMEEKKVASTPAKKVEKPATKKSTTTKAPAKAAAKKSTAKPASKKPAAKPAKSKKKK